MQIARAMAEALIHQGPCSAAQRGLASNSNLDIAYNRGICPFCDLVFLMVPRKETLDIISCQTLEEAMMEYRHFVASNGLPTKVVVSKHRWKRWMSDLDVSYFQGVPVELIE